MNDVLYIGGRRSADHSIAVQAALADNALNESLIRNVLPSEVVIATGPIELGWHDLDPREFEAVRGAVPQRLSEFAAGRRFARTALAELGVNGSPLLVNLDRSPRWPAGVIGSITHSRNYCAVAVARAERYRAIGIDAQHVDAVEPHLWNVFCTEEEIDEINQQDPQFRKSLAAMIFSAKESYFKASYPIHKEWIGFHDLRVHLLNGEFSSTSCGRALQSSAVRYQGCFLMNGDLCFTSVVF